MDNLIRGFRTNRQFAVFTILAVVLLGAAVFAPLLT